MLRLGSARYDIESQITAITQKGLDPRNFILCTDDCHSGTLVHEGHRNRAARHAIACGCDPLIALQMATINTATDFGLERELGSIAKVASLSNSPKSVSYPSRLAAARGSGNLRGEAVRSASPVGNHARDRTAFGRILAMVWVIRAVRAALIRSPARNGLARTVASGRVLPSASAIPGMPKA